MGGGTNNEHPKSTNTIGRFKKRCISMCCKKKAKHFGYCKDCWKEKSNVQT